MGQRSGPYSLWILYIGLILLGCSKGLAQVRRPPPPPSNSTTPPRQEGLEGQQEGESSSVSKPEAQASAKASSSLPKLNRTETEWRSRLSPQQYLVTRRKATEQAFTGSFWNHHDDGVYACIGCETFLFDSRAKFESGTGWPSYWQPVDRRIIKNKADVSNGSLRTEVLCRVCDAHLGHVFQDGPRPTGLRYCINSLSLKFIERKQVPEHLRRWRTAFGLEPEPARDSGKTRPSEPGDSLPAPTPEPSEKP